MGGFPKEQIGSASSSPAAPACDAATRLLAAEAMLQRLEALGKEKDGAARAEDIECVHRMRVASRRLRTALELFGDCLPRRRVKEWAREVRRVTRSLGQARDADVQVLFVEQFLAGVEDDKARPGLARLLLRLRQHRAALQQSVLKALRRVGESGLIDRMTDSLLRLRAKQRLERAEDAPPLTDALLERARRTIAARLEELLAYEPFLRQPQAAERHHAMRIAAKHLRYAMEIFEPLLERALAEPVRWARKLQSVLGEIHDCDVWLERLPEFLDQERQRAIEYHGSARGQRRLHRGIHLLEQACAERRRGLFDRLGREWAKCARKRVWSKMLKALSEHAACEQAGPEAPASTAPTGAESQPPAEAGP